MNDFYPPYSFAVGFFKGNNMDEYKYIIWDWNGTLLEDINASLKSVNDMLESRGMAHIDKATYREAIGVPIRVFYDKVFDMSREDYNVIIKEYNEGYIRYLSECGLSDGAVELLEKFSSEGKKQVIVSSSNNAQLLKNVEKYGVGKWFDAILGAEDFMADSKIDRAINYLEKNNAKADESLVIGDLIHDAMLAEEINADCVLLSTGHETPERLASSGAKVIDSLREML